MSFDSRQTKPEDIADLQRVVTETGLFPPDMLPDMVASASDAQIWLTILSDHRPVGLIFAEAEHFTAGTWNLRALAVSPAAHRSGAGRAIVAALEQHLRSIGQRLLIVDTSSAPEQSGARAFYPAIGFEHEATIRDFWDKGDDKITYRKEL